MHRKRSQPCKTTLCEYTLAVVCILSPPQGEQSVCSSYSSLAYTLFIVPLTSSQLVPGYINLCCNALLAPLHLFGPTCTSSPPPAPPRASSRTSSSTPVPFQHYIPVNRYPGALASLFDHDNLAEDENDCSSEWRAHPFEPRRR
jgi:hypothetical protein